MWRVVLADQLVSNSVSSVPSEASPALRATPPSGAAPAIEARDLSLWYGDFQALFDVNFQVEKGLITSLIGPSGCGKSTLLKSVNRINDRLGYVRTTGTVEVLGQNVLDPTVDVARLRREVGMVFQRPNPLPLSVRDNVLFSHRLHHAEGSTKADEDQIVEDVLRQVLLWDDVKDRLGHRATGLSLEEQQKLCIARLLPVKPSVLLMDEPTSALDPAGTEALERLIWEMRGEYTILIVTHNMAQARRASDHCAFMLLGEMVEFRTTGDLFLTPSDERTADYIEGRYG